MTDAVELAWLTPRTQRNPFEHSDTDELDEHSVGEAGLKANFTRIGNQYNSTLLVEDRQFNGTDLTCEGVEIQGTTLVTHNKSLTICLIGNSVCANII